MNASTRQHIKDSLPYIEQSLSEIQEACDIAGGDRAITPPGLVYNVPHDLPEELYCAYQTARAAVENLKLKARDYLPDCDKDDLPVTSNDVIPY